MIFSAAAPSFQKPLSPARASISAIRALIDLPEAASDLPEFPSLWGSSKTPPGFVDFFP
jgi:hypothetical protein